MPARRTFAEIFTAEMGKPPPFVVPVGCEPLSPFERDGCAHEPLVGTPAAASSPMLITRDMSQLSFLPNGYFMTGFWGHGVNSYAFYLCAVDRQKRVFFRLPYGGAYGDIEQERKNVLQFLERYVAFCEAHLGRTIRHLHAIDSMGEGRYQIALADGQTITRRGSLHDTGDFEELLPARS